MLKVGAYLLRTFFRTDKRRIWDNAPKSCSFRIKNQPSTFSRDEHLPITLGSEVMMGGQVARPETLVIQSDCLMIHALQQPKRVRSIHKHGTRRIGLPSYLVCTAAICTLLLTLSVGSGCTVPPEHKQLAAFVKSHEQMLAGVEQRVEPADEISIEAPRIYELNGVNERVQPDGKISLRLIGEVKVAGLSPREVAAKLEQLVGPYYQNPIVHVRISSKAREVYYVFGQVSGVGAYRFTGRDTIMDVLAKAKPTFLAWKQRVKIIRPSPYEDDIREFEIDINRMIKTGDMKLNVLLEPGDIVYVPPTPLAWIGLRLQELVYPVSPVLDAYLAPADFAFAQDVYENPNGSQSQGRRGRRGRTR